MATDSSSSPPSSPKVKKEKSSKKRKTDLTEIEVDINLPEPPSKKAKRLLKKGKALPAKPKSDDEGDSDSDGEAKPKKEKKERSPYGIWIGNLRFTVTKQELKQWFVDNSGGAITLDDITRVHLPTAKPTSAPGAGGPKKPTENRGFAYVDFATFEANVAAIALSETEWYRRKVLIKDAKSFDGRPEKKEEPAPVDLTGNAKTASAATAAPASTSTKIFVGNLSFQVTEDDLREHFHKCGPIRWVKVATFEDTGKCKGYGWVNFENADAAQWAVKGFVKVRETIDRVEDFMDVDEKEQEQEQEEKTGEDGEKKEGEDEDEEEKKKPKEQPNEEPRVKTRKWWVNQLLGRTLKIELAEDDQTRYQKRFRGKGGAQRREQNGGAGAGDGVTEVKEKKEWKPREERKKEPKFHQDINVARLTGAAVAPTGKKTTFE
ncbi:hypothetical protein QBC40DRAFT_282033 [Triangularia verruculosa]|uniref:RRM domain-containing protein n=1 Tax=Triangularia verruculosa TaxID=2587418 RepID=A0AAN7ASC0_9PEZI|nr:hypothetical protein QBC40DRAFT_282033 [Triangularia verruculosa]